MYVHVCNGVRLYVKHKLPIKKNVFQTLTNGLDEPMDRSQEGATSLIVQYSYYMHASLGSFPCFDFEKGKQSKPKYVQCASCGF